MHGIPWGTLAPDDVEKIIAVLLSNEFPQAGVTRIKPSQGDGGLDVLVQETGGYANYQVKSFSTALTPGQWSQVKRSLKSAIATHMASDNSIRLTRWFLTLPWDATLEAKAKLAALAEEFEAPFPCDIRGLLFLGVLESRHPAVGDYYCWGGRERRDAAYESMLGLQTLESPRELSEDPAVLALRLAEIVYTLTTSDPHYAFEISTGHAPIGPTDRPGLVLSVGGGERGHHWLVNVIARYPDAPLDAPIPIKLQLDPTLIDPAELESFRKAIAYGTRGEITDGVRIDSTGIPGGLGGHGVGGIAVRSAGKLEGSPRRIMALFAHDAETPSAEREFKIEDSGRGQVGLSAVWRDAEELVAFSSTYDVEGCDKGRVSASWTLASATQWEGRRVLELADAFAFLGMFLEGTRIMIREPSGPSQEFARLDEDLDFGMDTAEAQYVADLNDASEASEHLGRVPFPIGKKTFWSGDLFLRAGEGCTWVSVAAPGDHSCTRSHATVTHPTPGGGSLVMRREPA